MERADSVNWSDGVGTGFYPNDLEHADLVRRLLMCQGSDNRGDIPLGDVRGWGSRESPMFEHSTPFLKQIGFNWIIRDPRH